MTDGPAPAPLLAFDDLRITFKLRDRSVEAVKGLSFSIAPGQVVALVGESGSGKSVSAMSILRLLQEPPATYPGGRILWKGEDILKMDAKRLLALRGGEVGMIFQEPMTSLNPTWTCGAQVEEALELHTTLDAAGRRERVIELFNQVGIPQPDSRIDQYPHEMSGGMRQRVCISMALACRPQLLIADEPTTALDVTIQAQILDLIKRLQKEQGMAVLFITHDLGVVAELADRVVLMRNGEKVEEGPVAEIFAAPKHPYTQGLLACRPRLGRKPGRLPTVEDFMNAEKPAT
ncbi:MAG: ABC transporter ATP-binding protein [Planctomycetes bacterium]|nr:ABC transporter ATP-binding protein [Planctomycetota bacterium]